MQRILGFNKFVFARNVKALSMSTSSSSLGQRSEHCQVLVVGGGSGGCAVAAKLSAKLGAGRVIVLEPADRHYYQPMFTLIGGGMKRLEHSYRPMADVLPKKAKWLRQKAAHFEPTSNQVTTADGTIVNYEQLLIATGLQLNYDKIPGLATALATSNTNVCSIYAPEYVEEVYECLRRVQTGNAIFTFPATPVKCPGAPQKICYISEHYFRKLNKRQHINIIYNTSLPVIFGVKRYADALWEVAKKRQVTVNTRRNLVEIKPSENIAIFENLDKPDELIEEQYSLLHVVPPMCAPDELSKCKELVNEAGFVNVDKSTLQHIKYKNVFAIGDSACTPNSKTAASAAAQSPVVYRNMLAAINGTPLSSSYNGYASCPLVTGYHSCILAEFDYNLTPQETFPVAQNKERYSMFVLKKTFMPLLYWHLMLNGYWNGPDRMRKLLAVLKPKVSA